jgi:hypothetical protein
MEKNGVFWGKMGFRDFGEKMKKWWQMDGRWRLYGDAVTVGRCLGGGIWILGRLGEERIQRRGEGLFGGGKGKESDLKAGHVRPKNE